MKRSTLLVTTLAIALAFLMGAPVAGWSRTEVASLGGTVCCLDLDLRVTVAVDDGQLRSAFEFAGRELACVTLTPGDAVRWGVPIVTIVTELQNARTDRLVMSRGNVIAR
jgi:hypothetical protein